MEALIFGLVGLVMTAIFLGATALPAVVAYLMGRRFKLHSVQWGLPILVIALPIAWAWAGYSTFKSTCNSLPAEEFVFAPATAPDGFLSDARHVDGADLVERGIFKFVERPHGSTEVRRDFAGERQYPASPIPVETAFIPNSASKSEYVVSESIELQTDRWWKPPIYVHSLQVNELKTWRILAKKMDLVFGGGVLGMYMRFLGGDQDFERVSCGYASKDIGAWRPSLTSRPRFDEYRKADAVFLQHALKGSR